MNTDISSDLPPQGATTRSSCSELTTGDDKANSEQTPEVVESQEDETASSNKGSDIFDDLQSCSISKSENSAMKQDSSTSKVADTSKLQSLCIDMFAKMSLYLNGEVDATAEDYSLLEKMNIATINKYKGMLQVAKNVGDNLHGVNQKFSDLQPYLDQIDQIEQSVQSLEQAAYKLDAYSKRLEERFKQVDRL